MVALHYLKYQHDLSDETLWRMGGEPLLAALQRQRYFQHRAPIDGIQHDALAAAAGRCRGRADAARHDRDGDQDGVPFVLRN
jgi:hypothetical protein